MDHMKIKYKQYKNTLLRENQINSQEMQALNYNLKEIQKKCVYYEKKYWRAKIINQSLIAAIQRALSNQVAQELIQIISEQEEDIVDEKHHSPNHQQLTNTLTQIIKTHNSKLISQPSADKISFRYGTPTKIFAEHPPINNKQIDQNVLSPFISKSRHRKPTLEDYSIRIDSGQVSTRRSRTPANSSVTTKIYCQLCQRVFAPNEFVSHAQRCKYELDDVSGCSMNESKLLSIDYTKMMRNLVKIKQEIENQIQIIGYSKQQIDKQNLKKKLQKDLKKIVRVINEKEEEIKTKKDSICTIVGKTKKTHKFR